MHLPDHLYARLERGGSFMPDVAIVGAGPAGVATAYLLRDSGLDVTVLEAGDEVGGRTRSVPVAGVPSNTGALFVYRATPAEELATELGIRTVAFTPDTYGIHVNGATVVDSDNDRLIDRLPICSTAGSTRSTGCRASSGPWWTSSDPAPCACTPGSTVSPSTARATPTRSPSPADPIPSTHGTSSSPSPRRSPGGSWRTFRGG